MAIADTEKVDYLWKKIGYGVAKTDISTNKKAYEESVASPLLIRGDTIWQQAVLIPRTLPVTSSAIVTIYKDGTGSWSNTIKCTEDLTSSDNRTWKTNLLNWINTEFGPTYQVQVYIDNDNATNPQTTGTKIFAAGSGNNDEWYFDYQAGLLHFIGINLPTGVASGITGKSIFISGARYIGVIGSGPNGAVTGPSGLDKQVQFNDNNVFAASSAFTFNKGSNVLTVSGNLVSFNANLGNLASANFLSGDGYLISNISSNALGNIGNIVDSNTGNINGNYLNASGGVVGNLAMHLTVTNNTVIDSFDTSLFRTAKYLIKAGNDTAYESIEVLLIHDGVNSYITVYGAVSTTDVDVINISSNIVGGNVKVYASGVSANTTVNLLSTYVKD
jgi:hypothetical protein